MNKRIGLFGGTFNPIHIGHATLAENVYEDFKLDEMVLIPSKFPPHKDVKGATEQDRYIMTQMTAKALGDGFVVSDYELASEGVSYSYRTVKHWRDMYPDAALFFVAGSDIFITIGTWGKWESLFDLTNFIVVNRNGVTFEEMLANIPESLLPRVLREYDATSFNEKSGGILLYNMHPVPVSSTHIRVCMAQDRCPELLPEDVYDYIVKNNLYI